MAGTRKKSDSGETTVSDQSAAIDTATDDVTAMTATNDTGTAITETDMNDKHQGNHNFRRNQKRGNFCREERWEAARDNIAGETSENRKTEETSRVISTSRTGNANKGESSGNHKVYCHYCWKDGYFSNQCPVKENEKQSAVNMVIAEVTDVQQVMTLSRGKVADWETQEAIRKKATEWI